MTRGAERLLPSEGDSELPWLWLGTWSLGGQGFGPHDEADSMRVLDRALDAGVRHFDTAGLYGRGRSERLLGRAVRSCRRRVFLSTKGGLRWRGGRVEHDASPDALRTDLEGSLERLGTDHVDLYQLHWPDPAVPVDVSVAALRDLEHEGLARGWGVGNLTADQVLRFVVPGAGIPHQVRFNPLHRAGETRAAGEREGRAVTCAVSPFEQGLLTSAPRPLGSLGRRDVRRRNRDYADPCALRWASELRALVTASPIPFESFVLLWILGHADVAAAVPGPRRPCQLDAVLDHVAWARRLGLDPTGDRRGWMPRLAAAVGPAAWAHLERPPTRRG